MSSKFLKHSRMRFFAYRLGKSLNNTMIAFIRGPFPLSIYLELPRTFFHQNLSEDSEEDFIFQIHGF